MQRYALGEGRFTVLYDFTNEKFARSPVNKGGHRVLFFCNRCCDTI